MSIDKNVGIKIVIAEQEAVDIHENIVDEMLEAIGFGHAMVTDLSTFSDFCFMDEETEQKIKNVMNNDFNLTIKITDTIAETAIKIYQDRKTTKNVN